MIKDNHYISELLDEIQKVSRDKNLLKEFLKDLLTSREFQEIPLRWQIIKQLNQGIPQRQIAKNLGVGIATITRGSKELSNRKGGFKRVLDRINKTYDFNN